MSWQRIDENTYIDDTLVTCAEYQLFIDEMREHGKYYQPDHWVSYQFPKGKAHEPILGVRLKDAQVFCQWLTNREDKKWGYRLPTVDEAREYLFPVKAQVITGYWTRPSGANFRCLFMDGFSDNSLKIRSDFTNTINEILDKINTTETARTANLELEIKFDYGFDLDYICDVAYDLHDELVNSEIPVNISQNVHIPYVEIYDIVTSLDFLYERNSDTNRNVDKVLSGTIEIAKQLDQAREYIISQVRNQNLSVLFEKNLTRSISLHVYLVILQERIAGRSPAFEGIRLVKERKQTDDKEDLYDEWEYI